MSEVTLLPYGSSARQAAHRFRAKRERLTSLPGQDPAVTVLRVPCLQVKVITTRVKRETGGAVLGVHRLQ